MNVNDMHICGRPYEEELLISLQGHKLEIERLKEMVLKKGAELQNFRELFAATRMVGLDLMYRAKMAINIDELIIQRRNQMKEHSELPTI